MNLLFIEYKLFYLIGYIYWTPLFKICFASILLLEF